MQTIQLRIVIIIGFILLTLGIQAQENSKEFITSDSMTVNDSIFLATDTLNIDTTLVDSLLAIDKNKINTEQDIENRFVPDPKRALWLSLVLPGAGQIYNRKYWKLPIVYGGFLGCTYALLWNQQMYSDYSQAYLDIMDDDPQTASYKKMLPPGYNIAGKEEQFKKIFKHKKDYYRKYRDLSIFCFAGVYLISVIDAYVDAQLSTFDISKDLTMRVGPSIMKNTNPIGQKENSLGLQCSLYFK